MTTFTKNPYAEVRKKINRLVFRDGLNKTLDGKFKHKQFSERFSLANIGFIGMGIVAQIASLTTAFVMLSYLFESSPVILKVAFSAILVLLIEMIKRESMNDVMKSIFQYHEVEKFPVLLALIMAATSIYISIEGAKVLPSLFISNHIEIAPEEKTPDAIEEKYNAQVLALIVERDAYKKSSKWQNRIAGKDRKEIVKFNDRIAAVEHKKDSALQALSLSNETQSQTTLQENEASKAQIEVDRAALGEQLVFAAIGFEVLFLFSICFSWWYYTECEKERQQNLETAETAINTGSTAKVSAETLAVNSDTLEVETVGARSSKKIGFKDYEEQGKAPTEVEKVKKDYTRVCIRCATPFVHKTHNHKYCNRACMLADREEREAKK
jgi:hypothetical protein